MIVLDASAAVELLLNTPVGARIAARVASPDASLCAPHLLDVEIAHVLRRAVRQGAMSVGRAEEALADWRDLDVVRFGHDLLLDRMWDLRENLTACDAAYVALAEVLGAVLVTLDARLAGAPHAARVEVFDSSPA